MSHVWKRAAAIHLRDNCIGAKSIIKYVMKHSPYKIVMHYVSYKYGICFFLNIDSLIIFIQVTMAIYGKTHDSVNIIINSK